MNFDITPYQKIGPLQFGMTQQDVSQSLGHIDRIVKTPDGVTELYSFGFDIVAQIATDTDQLIEVGFGHRAKQVSLGVIQFFEQSPKNVLAALRQIDPLAVVGYGAVLFPALGLSFTGFQDGHDEAKAVTAFRKGQWDDLIPSMKPFNG